MFISFQIGITINDQIIKLKILAVTGDCPALKIALNFIAHNGYHCCYFCYIRGIHRNGKRQYPFESDNAIRKPQHFAQDAAIASEFKCNEKGHLGLSVLHSLLDIPLPHSVIIDYAHVSLLRHSKSIFIEFYRRSRPLVRNEIDDLIRKQCFPHFFHRKMKPFTDLSFVKATEIRNTLFYGFLPIFYQRAPIDLLTHFGLYITALRLLHGAPILGSKTLKVANDLLVKYYENFSNFYIDLENFVLHLHSHYPTQCNRFGSLSHLGSFGQESLIGYVGSNHTGTRYHGNLICENYSLDFLVHHVLETNDLSTVTTDGPFDQDVSFDFKSNDIFLDFHDQICICSSIDSCMVAFRRCTINQHVFHSLQYKKRQKSVSYLVRFRRTNDPLSYMFGNIVIFFRHANLTYALIEKYSIQCLFSDLLSTSRYHRLLVGSIDHFFYVVSRNYFVGYECVVVSRIVDHCILFECSDFCIITPLSSYDEHD